MKTNRMEIMFASIIYIFKKELNTYIMAINNLKN